jgi:hypothetical protein
MILGIDPGQHGGWAQVDEKFIYAAGILLFDFDKGLPDYDGIRWMLTPIMHPVDAIFVEKQMPYGSATMVNVNTEGKIMMYWGLLLNLLMDLAKQFKIPLHQIHPRTWQAKILSVKRPKGSRKMPLIPGEKTKVYAKTAAYAQWGQAEVDKVAKGPRGGIHDGIVDALCIGLYGCKVTIKEG